MKPGFPPRPLRQRLDAHLSEPTATGCREWTGYRNQQGYGIMGVGHRTTGAHRVAYCVANGVALDDIRKDDVCHTCDNPPCCEPSHLFLGNARANMLDMVRKGRWGGPRGSKSHSAKLTEEQVREMRFARMWGGATYEAIGRIYGVTKCTAHRAITGIGWRHA